MAFVISRTGDLDLQAAPVTQEQRDALWTAFVTNWLDKHAEEAQAILSKPETQSA